MTMTFASKAFEFSKVKSEFEERLIELGVVYEKIGWDPYDCSLEIFQAADDCRLSEEAQRFCSEAGFTTVFVNHLDGWETHYNWDDEFKPVKGWRRRYVNDPNAKTSNVIAGEPNPGYYEISEWPEGWKGHEDWLETGFMRVVPQP